MNTCAGCTLRDSETARCPERDFVTSVDSACQRYTNDPQEVKMYDDLAGSPGILMRNWDRAEGNWISIPTETTHGRISEFKTPILDLRGTVSVPVQSWKESALAFSEAVSQAIKNLDGLKNYSAPNLAPVSNYNLSFVGNVPPLDIDWSAPASHNLNNSSDLAQTISRLLEDEGVDTGRWDSALHTQRLDLEIGSKKYVITVMEV